MGIGHFTNSKWLVVLETLLFLYFFHFYIYIYIEEGSKKGIFHPREDFLLHKRFLRGATDAD